MVGLTWMAQTGAFRSTQKISSLSPEHDLYIITHIKTLLNELRQLYNSLPADLSVLDGPSVPLTVNASKKKRC